MRASGDKVAPDGKESYILEEVGKTIEVLDFRLLFHLDQEKEKVPFSLFSTKGRLLRKCLQTWLRSLLKKRFCLGEKKNIYFAATFGVFREV